MAEVQIQDLNNPVASLVDHICDDCQHKNVCKYKKDFLEEYDLLKADLADRKNSSISENMRIHISCEYWESDLLRSWWPNTNPVITPYPYPGINPTTYSTKDPVPNLYEITCKS